MAKSKKTFSTQEVTTEEANEESVEALEQEQAEASSEEEVCPMRAEYELVELDAEFHRLIGVNAQVFGVSPGTYHRIFSHGANYARLVK